MTSGRGFLTFLSQNGRDYNNRGQVVLKIATVNDSAMFTEITSTTTLWVRAPEKVLQQLGAEENRFKELEITGLLRSMRTLDVAFLTFSE